MTAPVHLSVAASSTQHPDWLHFKSKAVNLEWTLNDVCQLYFHFLCSFFSSTLWGHFLVHSNMTSLVLTLSWWPCFLLHCQNCSNQMRTSLNFYHHTVLLPVSAPTCSAFLPTIILLFTATFSLALSLFLVVGWGYWGLHPWCILPLGLQVCTISPVKYPLSTTFLPGYHSISLFLLCSQTPWKIVVSSVPNSSPPPILF